MFRLFTYGVLILLSVAGCNGNRQPDNRELLARTDSLIREINDIRKLLERQSDTLKADSLILLHTDTLIKQNEPEVIEKKPEPEKKTPSPAKTANDTTYHRYTNGKVSVKITSWQEGRRKLFFYDLYGNNTFELEDIRLSYSVTTTLSFHANGAASEARVSTNPGASRFWYLSEITFSTTNEPLLKYDRKMPPEHLDPEESKPWFWNNQRKEWVRQEIIREQDTPSR